MGRKYQGKHNGKPRGKYVTAQLECIEKTQRDLYKLEWDVHSYLSDSGVCITYCIEDGRFYEGGRFVTKSYHFGGASIGVKYRRYLDQDMNTDSINIEIISNDSLDDVIEKITKEFPFFKRIK